MKFRGFSLLLVLLQILTLSAAKVLLRPAEHLVILRGTNLQLVLLRTTNQLQLLCRPGIIPILQRAIKHQTIPRGISLVLVLLRVANPLFLRRSSLLLFLLRSTKHLSLP